jgi:hypothetical protein
VAQSIAGANQVSQSTTPPTKRFDAFLDLPIINPWDQTLRIFGETVQVKQSPTGAAFVNYAGHRTEVLALLGALCGIYRGNHSEPGIWYFHSQIQPALRIAMLALQDKSGHQIAEDIQNALWPKEGKP